MTPLAALRQRIDREMPRATRYGKAQRLYDLICQAEQMEVEVYQRLAELETEVMCWRKATNCASPKQIEGILKRKKDKEAK